MKNVPRTSRQRAARPGSSLAARGPLRKASLNGSWARHHQSLGEVGPKLAFRLACERVPQRAEAPRDLVRSADGDAQAVRQGRLVGVVADEHAAGG